MLYNRTSHHKLRACMSVENDQRITLSFYRYFVLNDPQGFRDKFYQEMKNLQVFGRIYIAAEGINAQISVPQKYFDALQDTIYNYHQLAGVRLNLALEDNGKSFWVLQIKVRPSIVADGINHPTFNQANVGNYLNAEEVNILAEDPNVLFIDMRNHYEYEVGHFYNAIEIPSNTFREQLPMAVKMLQHYKDRKIVMYCTGGIRCEKASAWLLHNGFNDVYQVDGGIIEYVRSARDNGLPIKFIGKNFVFDARLGERVTPDVIAHCHQCDAYCDNHTNCRNKGCNLLFIQCSDCSQQYQYCCSLICQQKIYFSLATQRLLRTEQKNSMQIFNKYRKSLLVSSTDNLNADHC